MQLSPAMEKYILHWGEMGTRWGVNRTVAQIHALLYLSSKPLSADELTETLQVARSNVSTSIKELQSWGLVKTSHIMGERREHFSTLHDPWDLFDLIIDGRKKRELDPTLTMLRQCVMESSEDGTPPEVQQRMENVLGFLDTLSHWYDQIRRLPRPALVKLIGMGARIQKFLGK